MADTPGIDQDTLPPDMDPELTSETQAPPRTILGTLRQLGPGLIIAGSIVGSGELIATTKTGAQAGISLLWLIIIGCLIKVFVQIELGRHAITHGQTTLAAFNTVPGPRGLRANWLLWFWLLMMLIGLAQLGGIVGGVGQALAISFPITGDYQEAIVVPSDEETRWYLEWEEDLQTGEQELAKLDAEQQERVRRGHARLADAFHRIGERGETSLQTIRDGGTLKDPTTRDDKYWAALVAFITVLLLYNGRYGLIQTIATVLVVGFTFITVGNVIQLQRAPEFQVSTSDILRGLSFGLPDSAGGLTTALATFGIIGVGASELITYPYWCIEKGYAKFTGKRSESSEWATRARGWMKVMMCDALLSMVVYTIATLAFFLMGVAVLYNEGRDPDGMRMVSTLATAYVPVFGEHAKWLFLIGAVAVLYSTFLVANAGHSRMFTDALKVWGLMDPHDQGKHNRSISFFGVALPLICLALFWSGINPVKAVLVAGMMQATMLPMIGIAALYFRRTATDPRLAPSRAWDVMLVISCLGLLIAGGWGLGSRLWGVISDLM